MNKQTKWLVADVLFWLLFMVVASGLVVGIIWTVQVTLHCNCAVVQDVWGRPRCTC